ncbi:MAG: hypothetical protein PW786_04020 [Arachidicoccus sp.]|nr:hypothetical protein [Arachidicoccus sp.]
MLSEEEIKFFQYWEKNRLGEKKLSRQLTAGLPVGLSLGAAILLCFFTGWYQRAMMEANTEMSPFVLIVAIIIIAVVFGIFYKKQKWEQNEQAYKELLIRKKKEEIDK